MPAGIDVTVYLHNDDELTLVERIDSSATELPDKYSIELSHSSIKIQVFPHENVIFHFADTQSTNHYYMPTFLQTKGNK
jgi:hypothetical protein